MASELANQQCIPCRGGVPPLVGEEITPLLAQLGGNWTVVGEHHLQALDFTNKVGAIAESQGHHPDIYLSWGKVALDIWTHKIDGLTVSDFILAAKVDQAG